MTDTPEQKVSTYKIIDNTTVGFDIDAFQQELSKTRNKAMYTPDSELRITKEELIDKVYTTMTANDMELIHEQHGNDSLFKAKLAGKHYNILASCLDRITKTKLSTCPGIHERLFSIVDEYAEYSNDNIFLGKYLMRKADYYASIDIELSMEFHFKSLRYNEIKTRYKGNSLLSLESNYTIIDIETTGFDPNFDEIIELSAIRVENNQIVGEFSTLVKPENEISSFITALTGITTKMLESAPKIEDAIKDYIGFIGNSILLGHNVNFDINFIYDDYYRCCEKPFSNDFIDTMRLSRKALPELPRHRLKDLTSYYKIKTEGEHRGVLDCHATYKIYNALKEHIAVNDIDLTAKKHSPALNTKTITATVNSFDEEHPLYEKHIVFTGELEKMDRRYAAQIVANFGGINENGITKKTNYLILGNNDFCKSIRGGKSSKQKKAEEYVLKGQDLQIISETEFYSMIATERV